MTADLTHPRPCLVCNKPCQTEGQLCCGCGDEGHYVTDDSVVITLGRGDVEWAVVDNDRIILIEGATCPADVMASAHGHATRRVGVARRRPGGEWEVLGDG